MGTKEQLEWITSKRPLQYLASVINRLFRIHKYFLWGWFRVYLRDQCIFYPNKIRYVFVLLWVPTLSETFVDLVEYEDFPTGVVFSVFMTACMIGRYNYFYSSTLFSIVIKSYPNVFLISHVIFALNAIIFIGCYFILDHVFFL